MAFTRLVRDLPYFNQSQDSSKSIRPNQEPWLKHHYLAGGQSSGRNWSWLVSSFRILITLPITFVEIVRHRRGESLSQSQLEIEHATKITVLKNFSRDKKLDCLTEQVQSCPDGNRSKLVKWISHQMNFSSNWGVANW